MAAVHGSRKRRLGLGLAAWVSLALGVYAVLAVASIWGFLFGGFLGAMGALLAAAVLTDPAPPRTRRVAKIGLVLSSVALLVCAAVVIVWGASEL